MKTRRYSVLLASLDRPLRLASCRLAGASKEMIQLQTQVQALQDQMTQMQQSFNERMGVMKSLMDQNTDSMNKVTAAITAFKPAWKSWRPMAAAGPTNCPARSSRSMTRLTN